MSYSYFSVDQLAYFPNYLETCKKFFDLARDDKTKNMLESILYDGGYKNYTPTGNMGKNNTMIEIQRRLGLAYIAIRNPKTFDAIVENNIQYFHGTNANALPGIVTNGMQSVDTLEANGKKPNTGEEWSRPNGRNFISFTDVLDIAEGYSSLRPKGEYDNKLSFPAIIGTKKDDILHSFGRVIPSDLPEVGVMNSFSKEYIRMIMVPSSKAKFVRKMCDDDTLVLEADDIVDRFYYVDTDASKIYLNEEKYEILKKQVNKKEKGLIGVIESVYSRTASKIKETKDRIRNLIYGEEYGYGTGHSK